MMKTVVVLLAAACLAGCSQMQYAGKEYTFAANDAAAAGYIQLGCLYRTADAAGCAGAVKRAGKPDDAIEDAIVNRGTWWLEPDPDGSEIKIRWDSGEVAYIPAEKFDHPVSNEPEDVARCFLDLSC